MHRRVSILETEPKYWKVTWGFWSFKAISDPPYKYLEAVPFTWSFRSHSHHPNKCNEAAPLQCTASWFTWYFEGHNIRKESFILCLLGQLMRAQCILVLFQPRNSKGSSQSVCRVAHGLTGGELGHCRELGKETHRTGCTVNRCYSTQVVIWES